MAQELGKLQGLKLKFYNEMKKYDYVLLAL